MWTNVPHVVFSLWTSVESVSLITTGKFSHLLFDFVLSHFTFYWKYFYIWIIPGVSSFKWYDHGLSTSYWGGDISGLRSRTPSVVILCSFLNSDGKPNFFPNNDVLRKFKQKCIFLEKTFFHIFYLENKGGSRWQFCRASRVLPISKGSWRFNVLITRYIAWNEHN